MKYITDKGLVAAKREAVNARNAARGDVGAEAIVAVINYAALLIVRAIQDIPTAD